ncbi:MAG: guanylate kinase, partial [Bacteroidetes bacterium]|nr:guanylate kinase [Bacteroidota bacterium]
AGKTTLVHKLLGSSEQYAFSISACSREPRENERDGVDYYFIGLENFKQKISENAFVEWEEVYKDNLYGTLKSELIRIWSMGKTVVFDVDVVGGLNLKKVFKNNALAIFVNPPSMEILEQRLRERKTESEEKIHMRISKAQAEIERAAEFDVIIENNILEIAVEQVKAVATEFVNK